MSVVFRRVETSLQRMMKRPGGMKALAAVAAAEANLVPLAQECSDEVDRRIAAIVSVVQPGTERRLDEAELRSVIRNGEEALTACGGLTVPLLGETLRAVCALAEVVMNADTPLSGALEPAVSMLILVHRGGVDAETGATILEELQGGLDRARQSDDAA